LLTRLATAQAGQDASCNPLSARHRGGRMLAASLSNFAPHTKPASATALTA